MYTIENKRLRVGFELHGAEMVSMYDKERTESYLAS